MVRHVTGGEPLPTLAERHRDRERGETPGELRRHGLLYHREGGDTRRANNEETGRGEDIGSAAEVLRGDTLGSNPPYRPVGEGEDLAAVAAPGPEASHRQEVELKVKRWPGLCPCVCAITQVYREC